MTKDEARKELLETLEEYCHDKGYNLQVFAGMADWVYTLYPLQKKMTNREWINSLSNEQLVKLMRTFHEDTCEFCAYSGAAECGFCYDGQVAWMQMEHDDESFDERDYRYCV